MEREGCEESPTVMGVGAENENDGCATPIRSDFKIPEPKVCPPPPKKKQLTVGKKRNPPKNGYFQAPELELFFTMNPRRQACA
ncbi:conserved hypothetical protein [Ricinus communis]|uniref:Cyclin-dependent protein kinase inhibitor n=1 Tax=Ricinus communis TaxID=3988 RepID=B9S3H6_RICCO|nr:conserved hypothetical protein [Ricinus communis]